MNKKPLVTFIFGTRPEAIKLAPVILKFQNSSEINTRVVLSGQHKEMVDQVMEMFNLKPDKDLNIMQHRQTLSDITSKTLSGLKLEFEKYKPELVLVQGDTTTAFASTLAAFYNQINVGHIEAGLRTYDFYNPFPEEINRRLISQLATFHFAPTELAKNNLLSSNLEGSIYQTGNTVIDALTIVSNNLETINISNIDWINNKVILTTIHRRENWGKNLENICFGIKKTIEIHENVIFIIPMHRNKIVRDSLRKNLSDLKQVFLIEPLDYKSLLSVIKQCYCILSDSGGIQEEAPSFKKPILILRETTERQEIIDSGKGYLVGTNSDNIYKYVNKLIIDKDFYNSMTEGENPFGDGTASGQIFDICLKNLSKNRLIY